jgi:hypothetical protein
VRPAGPAIADPVERVGRAILAFHAGSACSDRLRGEPNSYNWIAVEGRRVDLEVRAWDGSGFAPVVRRAHVLEQDGWRAAAPDPAAARPA